LASLRNSAASPLVIVRRRIIVGTCQVLLCATVRATFVHVVAL